MCCGSLTYPPRLTRCATHSQPCTHMRAGPVGGGGQRDADGTVPHECRHHGLVVPGARCSVAALRHRCGQPRPRSAWPRHPLRIAPRSAAGPPSAANPPPRWLQELYGGRLSAHPSVAGHTLAGVPGAGAGAAALPVLLLVDTAGCDMEEQAEEEGDSKVGRAAAEGDRQRAAQRCLATTLGHRCPCSLSRLSLLPPPARPARACSGTTARRGW
jgi:hypothetical protein